MKYEKQIQFLVSSRLVLFLLFCANALTLWGQYQTANPLEEEPESLRFMDKYIRLGDPCAPIPIFSDRRGNVTRTYTIESTAPSMVSAVAFRTLTYVFFLQDLDPNGNPTGAETEVARRIENEASGPMGDTRTITFGGSVDIPLLVTGRYRVRLIASYEFLPEPLPSDSRLDIRFQDNSGTVTRFNNFLPANNTEIVIDENIVCFDFIACQKITDFSVNVTPNGDFISANVTPAGNYQFSWKHSPRPINTLFTGLNTNADNSVTAVCLNTVYRLTTRDPANGCLVAADFRHDGVFNPDADLFFDRHMCDHPQGKYAMNFFGFQGSDVSRIQSVRWNFGDGSSEVVRTAPQLGVFHIYPTNNPPMPQGTCYETWYELTSTNGCPARRDIEVCFEECSSPARSDSDLRTETTISPNPVSGTLNVKLKSGEHLDYLEILNIAGQVIHKEKAQGEETKEVDMSRYSSGIYLVKVKNTEGVQKVIKFFKN